MNLILLLTALFFIFCNVVLTKMYTLKEMVEDLVTYQDSKIARVLGCIFYGPAFIARFLIESVKSAK